MEQGSPVVELLWEIKKLLELKGENPFKIRAFEKAARELSDQSDLKIRASEGTLTELDGVGKGIAEVLTEYLLQGKSSFRDELKASLPEGLWELTQVSGIGPKRAMVLIKELGIHTLGELEYACQENRLAALKGFGAKAQKQVLDAVLYQRSNQDFQRLGDIEEVAQAISQEIQKTNPSVRYSETGDFRRKSEVLSVLEYLVDLRKDSDAYLQIKEIESSKLSRLLPIQIKSAEKGKFGYELAKTSSSKAHWEALGNPLPCDAETEEEFYSRLGLPWISPEIRESGEEVDLARKGQLDLLLPWNGIRGVFHSHTTRSDGSATLEQMVTGAKALGYEYIGISDHSQSAFYAQGLKLKELSEQEKEVKQVQERHPKIRIFWGIESDILADGSLDYKPEVLAKFDFVIASVHSRFKMDRATMTKRILTAIRNPYTRFIGHISGRLLLGRPGYEVDMPALIAEAARCDVAIELNAHPARLDIDWRWGTEMRKCRALTSINPDAHEVRGLNDVRYGIAMARKALLASKQIVNVRSASEVEKWLKRK